MSSVGPQCDTKMARMKLSVVVPVYNEERWVEQLLDRVLSADCCGCEREVIAVDDRSTDRSWQLLERMAARHSELRLYRQPRNAGKGAALRRGFHNATGDIVLVQDADLEYDPRDYPVLLKPILDGNADVVLGSRFSRGMPMHWHGLINGALTTLSNRFNKLDLTDMETCYKVFRANVIRAVDIEQDRFGFDPEIVAKVAKLGVRIVEVPISYVGRTRAEGKKIGWRDGLSTLYCILRYGLPSAE